jgi:lipoyl(octanoyl) transferase
MYIHLLHLGRIPYAEGLALQQQVVAARKQNLIGDTLLLLEHPPVLTLGRNASRSNILASDEFLAQRGIELHEINRGGDVTYHGPGQLIGYPILDLREWKRDVHAYFNGIERCLIDALAVFGIAAHRIPEKGYEGVWVRGEKIAAIGVHISRWITSHGFALNIDTDLSFFKYIVPCGLTKPVCSLRSLGCYASRDEVMSAVATSFANVFDFELLMAHQGGLAASICSKELQETR